MILRGIGIAQGNVADNAERDEGHLHQVAGLGDGSTLHVDSLGLGEVADNLAHLLLCVDKPVASDDKALVDGYRSRQLLRLAKQIGIGVEARGKALHLSVDAGADGCSAIDVVIDQLCTDYDILDADVVTVW